tara:strand:- start:276 stop:617 length:342 start_codon:yes stop_codon:yes gene_type:complete
MDENKVGSSLKDKREYDKKLLKDQRFKLQIENQKKDPGFNKKSKEMTKKMIEESKNYKTAKNLSELEGAKPGISVPTGKIKAFKSGGRVEYKHGGGVGCAKRGFGKALKKGKK